MYIYIYIYVCGVTCHTAEGTLDVLRPDFKDRIINHRGDVVWPPLSCDLIALDDYLWGAVKDKCYGAIYIYIYIYTIGSAK